MPSSQCTLSSLSQVQPLRRLQLPFALKWRPCRDMPSGMSSPYTVTLKHRIYVGGGGTISDDPHTVYEYHPQEDRWLKLERYPYRWFAMAVLRDKLTLVGGRTSTWPSMMVNRIAVWSTKGMSQQWTDQYPRMPTHRYQQWPLTTNGWWWQVDGMTLIWTQLSYSTRTVSNGCPQHRCH